MQSPHAFVQRAVAQPPEIIQCVNVAQASFCIAQSMAPGCSRDVLVLQPKLSHSDL